MKRKKCGSPYPHNPHKWYKTWRGWPFSRARQCPGYNPPQWMREAEERIARFSEQHPELQAFTRDTGGPWPEMTPERRAEKERLFAQRYGVNGENFREVIERAPHVPCSEAWKRRPHHE